VFKIDTIVIVNIEDDGGIKKENVTFEAINYETYMDSGILIVIETLF
jgi:transcriptional/translational regulatory protein YebC/TACO1